MALHLEFFNPVILKLWAAIPDLSLVSIFLRRSTISCSRGIILAFGTILRRILTRTSINKSACIPVKTLVFMPFQGYQNIIAILLQ